MSNVAQVNDASFQKEVAEAGLPVLVDFYATWCGPCKALAPVVDEIAKDLQGKLKVVKVDVDDAQDTASTYGIMSVPTLVVFKKGQEVFRKVGAGPKRELVAELQKVL
ncbi:MAG TPA: thioredoxin [Planctomycetota bacterium]|nr:thioredoxin [Planctomycetota bacterium]